MEELEARIRSLEALLIERLALDPPGTLQQLEAIVRSWPEGEERAQALQWLEEAVRRYDEFSPGFQIRPPK